jgi:regulatory protein
MDQPKTKKIIDEQAAYAKAEHYCAYQERAQQEVRDKLEEWGMHGDVIENIISTLIESNFLDEERFAKAYALGKFNQKGWGRIKIKHGLRLKKVPDDLIKKALLGIDGDEYFGMLDKILTKKALLLPKEDIYKRNYKLQQYALSRGYESDLIADVLQLFI